jgi:transcriptional regulator with XRE-family HTH domain
MSIPHIKPQFTNRTQPQLNQFLVRYSTMSFLNERVTEAIETSGVEVPDVARACGISVQSVYKWMNGKSKTISGANLMELSRLTGYEARWIICGKGEKRQDQKALSVFLAMQGMPEYKKDMLVQASNSLAEQKNGTH